MKRWMTVLVGLFTIAIGTITTSSAAIAESEPAQEMDDSTSVLQQFVDIPENKIPSALLRQAYGIAVIPSVFRIGFIGGVQHGKGVLSVRTADGGWSDPTFISMTGGSVGFQAGISSTDIILVFKTERSVSKIANGQFSLGADASVAAGPVGRSAGASTNLAFDAEVYSYSRSRGLFGGVAINGARIGIDQDANWLFYDQAGIEARTLLTRDSGNDLPQPGQRFVYTLNQYMPASDDQFHYDSNTGADRATNPNRADSGYDNGNAAAADTQGYGQTAPYNDNGNGVTVQRPGNSAGQNTRRDAGTSDYSGDYGGSTNDAANDNGY